MRFALAVLALSLFVADAQAGGKHRGFHHGSSACASCGAGACATGQCAAGVCVGGVCPMPTATTLPPQAPQPPTLVPVPVEPQSNVKVKEAKHKTVVKTKGHAALDQLNQQRAQRGLRPYVLDEGLQQAAEQCAQLRAANFIHGHLGGPMSDFALVPAGTVCEATGAGALTPDWGFAACCCYENYTYAGAAAVMGSDGRQYCSLFVR